jgi:hypothetical protein
LSTGEPFGGGQYGQERVIAMSATYSSAKTNEQTVEREDEELWALWEEVGSRGLDTWTGLPAMDTIPDGSGSEPPGGSCYHSLLVEDHFAQLEGEQAPDFDSGGYHAWLEYALTLLRRLRVREEG